MKQFPIWQYNEFDGYFEDTGYRIAEFLANLIKNNKWDEFVGYLDNIKVVKDLRDEFPEMKEDELDKMLNAYNHIGLMSGLGIDLNNYIRMERPHDGLMQLMKFIDYWPSMNDCMDFHKKMLYLLLEIAEISYLS